MYEAMCKLEASEFKVCAHGMRYAGISENDEYDDDVEPADDDREFMKLLSNEIDRVTSFYTAKVGSPLS